jgi:hypothetical protein
MSQRDDKPDALAGELVTSPDIELMRYQRGEETRTFNLRVVPNGAELWRVTERPGQSPRPVKECLLDNPDDAFEFLEEVRRTLIVGGWQEVL